MANGFTPVSTGALASECATGSAITSRGWTTAGRWLPVKTGQSARPHVACRRCFAQIPLLLYLRRQIFTARPWIIVGQA